MNVENIAGLFRLQRDAVLGVRDGQIVLINPAGERLFPYMRVGMAASSFLPQEILAEHVEDGAVSVVIGQQSCTVLVATMEDIRVYTVVPETQSAPEHELMLENISACMRRNLTVLNMAIDLITPAIEQEGEPKLLANLMAISKSYYQMRRTVDNIADYYQMRDGEGCLALQEVEIVELCRQLLHSASHFLWRRGINLHLQTELTSLTMAVDPEKFERMLLNLIANSVGHMAQGGEISLSLTRRGGQLLLTLRDNGSGIPVSELPHVFAYYKRERSTTDIHSGAGLGISIVREIARLHGGTVFLESQEGQGTTVSVRIPIQPADGVGGRLCEPGMAYGEDSMHRLLTELSDVLGYEAFNGIYLD